MTDPDGLASPGELAIAAEAIDDFARWTGRQGVCVGEIQFVEDPDGEDAYRGIIHVGQQLIEIGVGQTPADLRLTLLHELCHGLDYSEGLAPSHRDLFDETADELASPTYDDERSRLSEAFARACDGGPPGALSFALAEECPDIPVLDDVDLLMSDVVYLEAELEVPIGPPLPFDVEFLPLSGLPGEDIDTGLLSSPLGLTWSGGEAWMLWFAQAGVAWEDGSVEEETTAVLLRFDPETGTLTGHWAVPGGLLLSDPDGPPVLAWSDWEGDRLVPYLARLDPARDEMGDPVQLLGDGLGYIDGGVAREDRAWLRISDEHELAWFIEVDLSTGETTRIPTDEDLPLGSNGPLPFWMGDEIGVGLNHGGEQIEYPEIHQLLTYDPEARAWTGREDLPFLGIDGILGAASIAAAGDLLILPADYRAALSSGVDPLVQEGGLVAWDRSRGELRVPEDACNIERLVSQGGHGGPLSGDLSGGLIAFESLGSFLGHIDEGIFNFARFRPR